MTDCTTTFIRPDKLHAGDKVAILSPAFAAPGFAPEVHEQAMRRFRELTGLIPVEYPTTRLLGATPQARAQDITDAFLNPEIKAIMATIGGSDQITVTPHLQEGLAQRYPKWFLGYSDNTNLHNWLWRQGVASFYGGSTQVHLGAGAGVDDIHIRSLTAALMHNQEIILSQPESSEDFGPDWRTPEALTHFGEREATQPWTWYGKKATVQGKTWGGCIQVIDQLALADRLPSLSALEGGILLLESSEDLSSGLQLKKWVRGLGERGILSVVRGVLLARPPVSNHQYQPERDTREALRKEHGEIVAEQVLHYQPDAVLCFGVPFGHTRPQWIIPYGGTMTLDGVNQQVIARY